MRARCSRPYFRSGGHESYARGLSFLVGQRAVCQGGVAPDSGSRAWGFESPDSDFDVRFVYVRPVEHYLRLEPARDVLEWRIDEVLDVDGWDADKALRLLRGSNPSLFEWLASPIVYAEDRAFAVVRELAAECFSPVASAHHYLSMGRNHLAALAGETVRLKKCLYTMRAILAARWVVAGL